MDIELQICKVTKKDMNRIVEIYNWAIEKTSATFDTNAKHVHSQLDWFESHDEEHRVIVAQKNGRVLAWGSISHWSDRCAYS
jgi:phosphinothricin acetyltransferase